MLKCVVWLMLPPAEVVKLWTESDLGEEKLPVSLLILSCCGQEM